MKKQPSTLRQKLAKRTAKPSDKYILWIVLVLAAAGIVAVYSAISFLAETKADGDAERFLLRHVFRLALALGAIALFSIKRLNGSLLVYKRLMTGRVTARCNPTTSVNT